MQNSFTFWRRLLAFLLDMTLLKTILIIMSFFMYGFFSMLGYWGLVCGLGIFVLYFGLLNSEVGKGQTLGKKLFKIKVVNKDNGYISFKTSALRAAVLYLAVVKISGFPLHIFENPLVLAGQVLLTVCYFLNVYLFIFNRPARRMLQDFAADTYVVRVSAQEEHFNFSLKKLHYYFLGLMILVVVVLDFPIPSEQRNKRLESVRYIQEATGVKPFSLLFGHRKNLIKGDSLYFIKIGIKSRQGDLQKAQEISQAVLERYAKNPPEIVCVSLENYYNLGIIDWSKRRQYVFDSNNQFLGMNKRYSCRNPIPKSSGGL